MRFVVEYEYDGAPRPYAAESPGRFRRTFDVEGINRLPAVGEAMELGDRFVGVVTWVLWRTDGKAPEVHVAVHPGYESHAPSREILERSGWTEEG